MSTVSIKIPQGKLKGKTNFDIYKNVYYSFEGIPYGKPPIGNLRFMPPIPADPWDDEFDATIGTKICPSYANIQAFPNLVDEDCLRINVYTPADVIKVVPNLLPVMVFIHGGGFLVGSSQRDEYGPDFLMCKNVLLVTFNYRLAVLGFFSLNNVSLNFTGNAGLKDMIEALKWIKKNVSYFGGDPNNITVFGASAGAVAVNLLLLTPLAKGLFQRAILQSGSSLIPGAFKNDRSQEIYDNFLVELGCDSKDPTSICEFLQSKPYEELCLAEGAFFGKLKRHPQNFPNFIPSREINHASAFISESPWELMKNGKFYKCPIIIGYLENDGGITTVFTPLRPNTTDLTGFIPEYVLDNYQNPELIQKMLKLFQLYYYGNESPSYSNKDIFNEVATDVSFLQPVRQTVQYFKLYSTSPIYYYKFSMKSKLNWKPNHLKHSDDERYIFSKKSSDNILEIGSREEKCVNLVTTLWTNFAKSSNPNSDNLVEWKPCTQTNLNCLEIDLILKLIVDPRGRHVKFLETLYNFHSKI